MGKTVNMSVGGLEKVTVWTIGYDNRSMETFLDLLKEHKIEVVVDVRSFPTSRIPHFRREELERWLPAHGIAYVWLGRELGGYRRGGYEAYMRTCAFQNGVRRLLQLARERRTCIMCMEANPKYCHRRFIAAHLERLGVRVIHILKRGQVSLTKFGSTPPARSP